MENRQYTFTIVILCFPLAIPTQSVHLSAYFRCTSVFICRLKITTTTILFGSSGSIVTASNGILISFHMYVYDSCIHAMSTSSFSQNCLISAVANLDLSRLIWATLKLIIVVECEYSRRELFCWNEDYPSVRHNNLPVDIIHLESFIPPLEDFIN